MTHTLNLSGGETYIHIDKYREEQLLRLDTQDKLAVADETVCVLEDLLARVTAELKKVSSENASLRTENCILKLGNANRRPATPPPTVPWTIGDPPYPPARYPEWYLRPFSGSQMLCSSDQQVMTNFVSEGDPR